MQRPHDAGCGLRAAATATLLVAVAAPGCVGSGRPQLVADPVRAAPRAPMVHYRPGPAAPSDARSNAAERRLEAVAAARRFLDGAPLTAGDYVFEPDPVGFVRAAYWSAGIDLFDARVADDESAGGLEVLYRSAARRDHIHTRRPRAGDLVFLDRHPGSGDPPAAVAVVESVSNDGTVIAIGSFAGGPRRIALNLRHPDRERSESGQPLNLAMAGGQTTAELFRSFADPFGD